jgi:hypothetical protein
MRELREKDEQIRELSVKAEILQNTLKMLPEGKSPIELRQEWDVRERQQAQLQEELQRVTDENATLQETQEQLTVHHEKQIKEVQTSHTHQVRQLHTTHDTAIQAKDARLHEEQQRKQEMASILAELRVTKGVFKEKRRQVLYELLDAMLRDEEA